MWYCSSSENMQFFFGKDQNPTSLPAYLSLLSSAPQRNDFFPFLESTEFSSFSVLFIFNRHAPKDTVGLVPDHHNELIITVKLDHLDCLFYASDISYWSLLCSQHYITFKNKDTYLNLKYFI